MDSGHGLIRSGCVLAERGESYEEAEHLALGPDCGCGFAGSSPVVCKVTVICNKKQSLRITVKSADGKKSCGGAGRVDLAADTDGVAASEANFSVSNRISRKMR